MIVISFSFSLCCLSLWLLLTQTIKRSIRHLFECRWKWINGRTNDGQEAFLAGKAVAFHLQDHKKKPQQQQQLLIVVIKNRSKIDIFPSFFNDLLIQFKTIVAGKENATRLSPPRLKWEFFWIFALTFYIIVLGLFLRFKGDGFFYAHSIPPPFGERVFRGLIAEAEHVSPTITGKTFQSA